MSVITTIIQWTIDMVGQLASATISWWVYVPTGNIVAASNKDGPIQWIWQHTTWITAWIALVSILFSAGRLAIQRKAEPAVDVAKGIFTMIVVMGCGLAVVALLTEAGDQFSRWIIDQATDQDFGKAVVEWLQLMSLTGPGGPILALILALLATLACLAQVGLMLVRTAMLILLCGTLPMAAAASSTPSGRQTFQKTLSWLIAFLLYKPVAAIVYACAFRMIASLKTDPGSGGLITSISGIVLMLLAVVALPALMRFVTPVVGAAGGGSGGAGAVGTMGAIGSIATGAKSIGGAGRGAQGANGQGSPGAKGGAGEGGATGSKSVPSQAQGARGATGTTDGANGAAPNPAQGAGAAQGGQGAQGGPGAQGAGRSEAAGAASSGAAKGASTGAAGPAGVAVAGVQAAAAGVRNATENVAGGAGQEGGGPSGSR
ncbi:hypothetical protein ACFZDG_35540 [Kitasatospora xanthocidica]|uniref:hypothetical protein n=1 Tax=Kitasatospora xanthocidica TaxID=83382 RepID=UPI0036E370C9